MSTQRPKPTNLETRIGGYELDPVTALHQLFRKRMEEGNDLKVIITAKDSRTGVGKSTLACWLALQWHQIYTGEDWNPKDHATFDVSTFFDKYRSLPAGSVLLMDEAEQLDSRRSMASENVKFSHYWMAMRVRQVASILALPSTTALDKRLEELADVWIEVQRRGMAKVHGIQVESYQKTLQTPKVHWMEFPDISDHPAVVGEDLLKEKKIDRELSDVKEENEEVDPEDAKRDQKVEIAQRMRDNGHTLKEIADCLGMSKGWASENTVNKDKEENA